MRSRRRFMLSRCDRIAEDPHYRKGEPVRDLFARDREAMAPMPGTRFDACRWEVRKADGEGCAGVDSHRYLAGPSWRGWTLDVGLRAFDACVCSMELWPVEHRVSVQLSGGF